MRQSTSNFDFVPLDETSTASDKEENFFQRLYNKHKYGVIDFLSTPTGWMIVWLFLAIVAAGGALTLSLVFKVGNNEELVIEISSQILNAIFTLMALSNHPLRLYDAVCLFRGPSHMTTIRARHPWYHSRDAQFWQMLTVMFLLNLNCFAQYPMVVAMWGYNKADRPNIVVSIALPTSFLAGIAGAVVEHIFSRRVGQHLQASSQELSSVEK